ncbi:MAG: hypothetical protein CL878_15615 [Dehalococcoidia bacterium]|nr:hypothetical protein [Dehalococcoidia bacterium]
MSATEEFFASIKSGDLRAVREQLRENPQLARARDANEATGLTIAAYSQQRDIAQMIMDAGAQPSVFEAAALGDEARVLDSVGADKTLVRARAPDGWTALGLAAGFGNVGVVDILLDSGADTEQYSANSTANTALHAAAFFKQVATAERLIERGANVNSTYRSSGDTSLHVATWSGDLAMVNVLLEHGADPGIRNAKGELPVDSALSNGRTDVAKRLNRV